MALGHLFKKEFILFYIKSRTNSRNVVVVHVIDYLNNILFCLIFCV